jgi:hypothetical protein
MTGKKLLLVLVMLAFGGSLLYCQDAPSLGEIARRKRAGKNSQSPTVAQAAQPGSSSEVTPTGPTLTTPITRYEDSIRTLLEQEKFETLDSMADSARSTKSRLAGGFWTLHTIYRPLGDLPKGRDSDAEWMAQIDRLKRWVAQRPQSITARVALGSTYIGYAWKARSEESADKVTEEGWKLFHQRADMAAQTLIDAYSLPTKCPEWFLTMQFVAEAQERSREAKAAIFEKAVAFEPDYQYFYRVEARSLLPEWDGEDDSEMDAFATRMADRLGGKKGDMLYYQIAANVICVCKGEPKLRGMSWPRIKSGYAAVDELYGPSLENMNKVARLAGVAGDADYADDLFARIGDSWDPAAWSQKRNFELVRDWARATVSGHASEAAFKAANDNLQTPDGRTFAQQVTNAFSTNYRSVITECRKSSSDSLVPLELAMRLSKDGDMENLFVSGLLPTCACVSANIRTGKFPVPPSPSYWVKIRLEAK